MHEEFAHLAPGRRIGTDGRQTSEFPLYKFRPPEWRRSSYLPYSPTVARFGEYAERMLPTHVETDRAGA